MAPFLVTFTGASMEATLASSADHPTPSSSVTEVGLDPEAREQGWVKISARDTAEGSDGETLQLLVPHYQPTAYIAGARCDDLLAIGIDQTLIVLWRDHGRLSHSIHQLPSPVIALVEHEDALYVVHEAGVDGIARVSLDNMWAGSGASWLLRPGSPPRMDPQA